MQGFTEHEAGSSETRAPVPPSTAGNHRRTPSPAPAVSLGSGPTDATRRSARSPCLPPSSTPTCWAGLWPFRGPKSW